MKTRCLGNPVGGERDEPGSDGLDLLREVARRGGPAPEDYRGLDRWFSTMTSPDPARFETRARSVFSDSVLSRVFSPATCQGFVMRRPRGYNGDFEIIERIYRFHRAEEPDLIRWDHYFHSQPATDAVRNRVSFIRQFLAELSGSDRVLSVGCGPCRELRLHTEAEGELPSVTLLDRDPDALSYARKMLDGAADVHYVCRNALRYRPENAFDFVYSAGLFDYLSDRSFVRLARTLHDYLAPGGRLVIGNFSDANPSRGYMEFGGWFLHHRSEDQLRVLALQAGFESYRIEAEASGVNLFLVAQRR